MHGREDVQSSRTAEEQALAMGAAAAAAVAAAGGSLAEQSPAQPASRISRIHMCEHGPNMVS